MPLVGIFLHARDDACAYFANQKRKTTMPCHRAFLLAFFLLPPACASTPAQPPVMAKAQVAPSVEDLGNKRIAEQLENTMVNVTPGTLGNTLDAVLNKTNINHVVLWKSLKNLNIDRTLNHQLTLRQVSVKAALTALFASMEDNENIYGAPGFSIHQGVLWIGPVREIKQRAITEKTYDLEPLFAAKKGLIDMLNESDLPTKAMEAFAVAHGIDQYITKDSDISNVSRKLEALQEQAAAIDYAIQTLAKKTKTDIQPPKEGPYCVWGAQPPMNFLDTDRIMENAISTIKNHVGTKAEWDDNLSVMTADKFTLHVKTTSENHIALRKLLDETIAIELNRQEALITHVYVMHYVGLAWRTLSQSNNPSAALVDARKALAIAPDHPTAKAMVLMLEKLKKAQK